MRHAVSDESVKTSRLLFTDSRSTCEIDARLEMAGDKREEYLLPGNREKLPGASCELLKKS
jgi:hypothetical protein